LLILTNNSFKDHLFKLEISLARLLTTGMRVNISKSKFFVDQIEYLGYWITRQGIQPIRNKVEKILNIKAPKTRKELRQIRQFIGIVNYYHKMWFLRSALALLTGLTSSKVKFEWRSSHQQAFEKLRKSLEWRYFSVIQTSISPIIFILMHQVWSTSPLSRLQQAAFLSPIH
jgi:hypothetical protein